MDITLAFLKSKVAVVTGASAGIGEAIATALVNRGLQVVGLARRKEQLSDLGKRLDNKSGKFFPVVTDITKEDDIVSAFRWIKENVGPVHVLVNNAGIMCPKGLVDGDPTLWKTVFDTNILGLCIATKLAIANMKDNNVSGHIIHINSISGHHVPHVPEVSVYCASKFAVTALTETLRRELITLGSKIRVTSISPGYVHTEIESTAGIYLDNNTVPRLNSEDIADSVVYALSTPPHVQVHEIIIRPQGETL